MFIDRFGLYRNIYRSLIGFYLLNGLLSNQERNRRINVIPLILGPYRSNIAAVIAAISLSMSALDTGVELEISGTKTIVYVMLFFFIGNMLQ
jgi:putative Mn2+ efflux pump MntP